MSRTRKKLPKFKIVSSMCLTSKKTNKKLKGQGGKICGCGQLRICAASAYERVQNTARYPRSECEWNHGDRNRVGSIDDPSAPFPRG